MFVAAAVVSGLFAALLLASGAGKLAGQQRQVEVMRRVGFPENRMWLLALAEFAGAFGLVVGLFWWPIGVAAAIGVILYFVGAEVSHLRVRDPFFNPALLMLGFAVVTLILRLLSR